MSTEIKKQGFIPEALQKLCALAVHCGFNEEKLETFEELASQLLKESFKNGLKAAYRTRQPVGRTRAKESKEITAEYQTGR